VVFHSTAQDVSCAKRSAISFQPSAFSYQLSAISHQLLSQSIVNALDGEQTGRFPVKSPRYGNESFL
jgi:hypothetical protein